MGTAVCPGRGRAGDKGRGAKGRTTPRTPYTGPIYGDSRSRRARGTCDKDVGVRRGKVGKGTLTAGTNTAGKQSSQSREHTRTP